ncbi:MAG: class I SAM-dependent methyltransferase [Gaiellales bacterium]
MSAVDCPLCGGATTEAFVVGDRNRGIGTERFAYRRCADCRSYHVADPPADLGRYYPEEYYGLPGVDELDRYAEAEKPKIELLRPFARRGSLADVGAGLGTFARAAANAGYDVTAIEMDGRCCRYLEEVVGVHTIQSDRPDEALATLRPMETITLWHVLEHLPNPWVVLEAAADRLEPGGVLLVATPNPDSLQLRILRTRWAHIDAPRHLFLISFAALRDRAAELGLVPALVTTSDQAGRQCNRFAWEYGLRHRPSEEPMSARGRRIAVWRSDIARFITAALGPLEHRGMNGAAYTAVFVKSDSAAQNQSTTNHAVDAACP